jgi:hypothetical protein
LNSLLYFGSFAGVFAVKSPTAGVPLAEEALVSAGCTEASDFPCDEAGLDDSGGVAALAPDRGGWSVMGGTVGESVELCPAVVGPVGAAGEGFDCAPAAGGLGVCSAAFEDAAEAEQGGGGNASEGKTSGFTTDGSSWSFT